MVEKRGAHVPIRRIPAMSFRGCWRMIAAMACSVDRRM